MRMLASGVAHLSFPGGGMFLPVRTPYDRQTLIEHVSDRVRSKTQVQVLIDKRRWLIGRTPHGTCSSCGRAVEAACHEARDEQQIYCMPCVFAEDAATTLDWSLTVRRSA